MEDMTVTVAMTTDDFLEFVAWGKDRDYYKSRLDKELNKREILAKKTCWAKIGRASCRERV